MADSPDTSPAWKQLGRLAAAAIHEPVGSTGDPVQAIRAGNLTVDLSLQRLNNKIVRKLVELGEQRGLPKAIADLLAGEPINNTENRAAFHTGLRSKQPRKYQDDIVFTRQRIIERANAIREGRWRGHTGKVLNHIVNVGIGGSRLGPELLTSALGDQRSLPVTYLSNVDGHAAARALAGLDPERCLVIVVSKSMSTVETKVNAATLRSWFLERTASEAAISQHFLAVSANVDACRAFGIPPDNVFPMWDWVGGRYSVWSAVGLTVATSIGTSAFLDFLHGAEVMDQHFERQSIAGNAPALLALADLWNFNFLGASSRVVLPYDNRLTKLIRFLQQLEMESNGKRVHATGEPINMHTAPVVWGDVGTDSQHSFHQMLHQGTRAFAADLIAVVNPEHTLNHHRDWLHSHFLGQIGALVAGNREADAHRAVPGNHSLTTILLDTLTPATLGQLIALFEHRTFCLATLWGINAFDQWGVELGKNLAAGFYDQLRGNAVTDHDLVAEIRRRRSH